MHICLLTHEFPPDSHGGLGSNTSDLARGLVQHGHQVTVVVVGHSPCLPAEAGHAESYTTEGARVVRIAIGAPRWLRWRPGLLWQRWQLRQFILREHRKVSFDVIKTPEVGGMFPFGLPSALPLVTTLHGSNYFFHQEMGDPPDPPFIYRLERRSMAHSRKLIANSRYTARRMAEFYHLDLGAIGVIHNAVDTNHFSPDPIVPVERGLIVFANSIQPRKGIGELLEAMAIVVREAPHARLVVIGKEQKYARDGVPYSEHLRSTLSPEVSERVSFIGPKERRTELLHFLRRANVCCYPSRAETFGIAPAEAMSVGKPVIYSRLGPGPELIEDGISGLLCDPLDPRDIARGIGRILSDDAFADSLGKNARRRAVEMFDYRDWAVRHAAAYGQAAGIVPEPSPGL